MTEMDCAPAKLILKDVMYYDTRLSSFDTWPCQIKPEKQELARAGFMYTGHSDRVKCVVCNVELHNWLSNENALREHAKWSPDCSFLKIIGYDPYAPSESSTSSVLQPTTESKAGLFGVSSKEGGFRLGPQAGLFAPRPLFK